MLISPGSVVRDPGCARSSRLSPESRDFRRAAAADAGVLGHLVTRKIGRRRDALDLELELVDVRSPTQRFLDGHKSLLIQVEDRLVERLHPVLRGARRDGAMDLRGSVLVDDAVAD